MNRDKYNNYIYIQYMRCEIIIAAKLVLSLQPRLVA